MNMTLVDLIYSFLNGTGYSIYVTSTDFKVIDIKDINRIKFEDEVIDKFNNIEDNKYYRDQFSKFQAEMKIVTNMKKLIKLLVLIENNNLEKEFIILLEKKILINDCN